MHWNKLQQNDFIKKGWKYLYAMWSRGISQKSNMWYFQFSIWLKSSLGEGYFAETLPASVQWFQSYSDWKILKTTEKNAFLFLAVCHNQSSWLPTPQVFAIINFLGVFFPPTKIVFYLLMSSFLFVIHFYII